MVSLATPIEDDGGLRAAFSLSASPVPVAQILSGGSTETLNLGLKSLPLAPLSILRPILQFHLKQRSLLRGSGHHLKHPLGALLPFGNVLELGFHECVEFKRTAPVDKRYRHTFCELWFVVSPSRTLRCIWLGIVHKNALLIQSTLLCKTCLYRLFESCSVGSEHQQSHTKR